MGQGFAELAGSLTTADRLALISELLHVGASSQIEPVSSGRGFVFYDGTGYAGGRVTDTCTSYLFMSGLNLLDYRMLAVFYLLAMCYIFVGIAIISDVFMGAIERITSQTREKLVTDREGRTSYVVTQVWNPTVANLTLMALGSSAPEIVLAIYGTVVTLDSTPDILGPATIVGSAAYNMFVIIGICIMSLPAGEVKQVEQLNVFGFTALMSLFAYIWLFVCLQVSTPNEVTITEGVLTFAFFPAMVLFAYHQDIQWRPCRRSREKPENAPLTASPVAGVLAKADSSARRVRRESEVDGFARRERAFSQRHETHFSANLSATDGHVAHTPALHGGALGALVRRNTSRSGWNSILRHESTREHGHEIISGTPRRSLVGTPRGSSPRTHELQALMRTLSHIRDVDHHHRTVYGALERVPTRGDAEPSGAAPSGLRYRMEAVRGLTGQRRLVRNDTAENRVMEQARQEVVGKEGAAQQSEDVHVAFKDDEVSVISFLQPVFNTSAEWPHAYATVVRRGFLAGAVTVTWQTVDRSSPRTAKLFSPSSGILEFEPGQGSATLKVPLTAEREGDPSPILVALTAVHGEHTLLTRANRAKIKLVPKRAPNVMQPMSGSLQFAQAAVTCSEHVGQLVIEVVRVDGSDGMLELDYRTADGTGLANVDYEPLVGTIVFGPGEVTKILTVPIKSSTIVEHDVTFSLELVHSAHALLLTPEAMGVGPLDVCEITILDEATWKMRVDETLEKVRRVIAQDFYATDSWAEQFKNAIVLSGGVNEETGAAEDPTVFDSVAHIISFFWKVLFACVPPSSYCGGWAAFGASLFFIALCTAFVSEFASNFGCVLGLPDAITAISIVALGTSLPDTFASKILITNDPTADNAVGNVTGSNSVNVFLGLGIPWIIGSFYHRFAPSGAGTFYVPADGLSFAVALFAAFAVLTLCLLMGRRAFLGGEVGGSKSVAYLSAGFLFLLWVIYVVLASLNAVGLLPAL